MQVVLGIYSGRKNPVWSLPIDKNLALTAMLAELPPVEEVARTAQLGYHGLFIEEEDDAGFPSVHVFNGFVTTTGRDGMRFFLDQDRKFEKAVFAAIQEDEALSDEEIEIVGII